MEGHLESEKGQQSATKTAEIQVKLFKENSLQYVWAHV